jgi:hypothetical protein
MLKQNYFLIGGLIAIFCFSTAGCNLLNPEPEATFREAATAFHNLVGALEPVHDASSAQASLAVLDDRYAAVIGVLKRMPDIQARYKDARVSTDVVYAIRREGTAFQLEMQNLNHTSGLPVEFWKVVKRRSFEIIPLVSQFAGAAVPSELKSYLQDVTALYNQCKFEEIVTVDVTGLSADLREAVVAQVHKIAPEARLCQLGAADVETVILGPVKNFHEFVGKLDLGTVTYQDESRHGVEIMANRMRIARLDPNSGLDDSAAKAAQAKMAEEMAAREREMRGPDPKDPNYLDKMADRMLSGNILYKDEAIDALLRADPANASPETKKKIARAFKTLVEEAHSFELEKAVRGLSKWAGTYSVPILVKLLNNGRHFDEEPIIRALAELQDPRAVPALVKLLGDSRHVFNEELIIKTLAEFKDPQAAPALAARITDFRVAELACDGLREIGSGAEDAVIAVGESENPKTCAAALSLLGDIGTGKSLDLMHRAQMSRDRNVRATAMTATAKINRRRLATKAKSKPKEE